MYRMVANSLALLTLWTLPVWAQSSALTQVPTLESESELGFMEPAWLIHKDCFGMCADFDSCQNVPAEERPTCEAGIIEQCNCQCQRFCA
jgi:hypothetical protein